MPRTGRVPKGHGSVLFDHQGAPCADGRHHGTEAVRRAEGSASVSLADACCIVVSLMAGVRPEAQAIEWEEDIDLCSNPPSVAVLRA